MATASPRETVRALLAEAVAGLAAAWGFAAQVAIERTKRPEHGDFASNVAAFAIDRALTAGFIDRHDDAVWLRTTALWNDDKCRVVMKSDGLEENITKEDD